MPQAPASHTFRFFRSGGFDQVRLDRGEDLLAIERLDQKLWVALACPTRGLEIDPKTMDLVDLDHDGKIRAPELIAALRWATSALTRPAALIEGAKQGGSLPLADIDGASPVGAALLAAAKRILHNLGKDGATAITLADVSNTNAIFANQLNGDGVIPLGLIPDPAARVLADDIVPLLAGPDGVRVQPGYPHLRLWPDVLPALGTGDLPPLTPTWDKRYRDLAADAPRLESMAPRDAVLALVANAYMGWLPDAAARARDLALFGRVARDVPVVVVVPHADPRRVGEMCARIEADFAARTGGRIRA